MLLKKECNSKIFIYHRDTSRDSTFDSNNRKLKNKDEEK